MNRKELAGLIGVVLVVLVMAGWLYGKVMLPLASIGWDEGVHLLDAFNVASVVQQGRITEALRVTYGQFFYPPGYSWLVMFWSFVGGLSLTSFRLWSLVAWVGSAILVYLITIGIIREIGKIRVVGGVMAAGLFMTAPIYWIFGTQAMLELTGVLGTLVVAGLILWSDRALTVSRGTKPIWRWVLVGIGLAGLHFIKYNYAMWMIGGIVADAMVEVWMTAGRRIKSEVLRLVAVMSPVAAVWILWVVVPGRLQGYLHYFNDPNFYSYELIPLWKHLVWFFPMSILNSYLASPWLGVALVAGMYGVMRISQIRQIRLIRVMGIVFLVNLFFATIHFHNQQERYIITTVPMLYVLGGVGITELVKVSARVRGKRRIISLISLISLIGLIGRDIWWDMEDVWKIGEHMLNSPIYASAGYHDTMFNFDKNDWVTGKGQPIGQTREKPVEVLNWIVENTPDDKPLNYFGRANEVSPPAIEYLRACESNSKCKWGGNGGNQGNAGNWGEYIVTLDVAPGSVLDTYDWRKMNQSGTEAGLAAVATDPRWGKVAENNFEELGVKATIWGR